MGVIYNVVNGSSDSGPGFLQPGVRSRERSLALLEFIESWDSAKTYSPVSLTCSSTPFKHCLDHSPSENYYSHISLTYLFLGCVHGTSALSSTVKDPPETQTPICHFRISRGRARAPASLNLNDSRWHFIWNDKKSIVWHAENRDDKWDRKGPEVEKEFGKCLS